VADDSAVCLHTDYVVNPIITDEVNGVTLAEYDKELDRWYDILISYTPVEYRYDDTP
jgi:hypothetical protein